MSGCVVGCHVIHLLTVARAAGRGSPSCEYITVVSTSALCGSAWTLSRPDAGGALAPDSSVEGEVRVGEDIASSLGASQLEVGA